MAWRPRANDELPGGSPSSPPLPSGMFGLVSDVVKITGVGSSDLVVLEMAYSFPGGAGPAQTAYNDGALYLGEYSGSPTNLSLWSNPAIIADKTAWGATIPTSGLVSGEWGANGSDVWVVLPGSAINGNQFAAVPEPGTIALLLAGCFALIPVIRRRMKKS